jgi:hypothetical protein
VSLRPRNSESNDGKQKTSEERETEGGDGVKWFAEPEGQARGCTTAYRLPRFWQPATQPRGQHDVMPQKGRSIIAQIGNGIEPNSRKAGPGRSISLLPRPEGRRLSQEQAKRLLAKFD